MDWRYVCKKLQEKGLKFDKWNFPTSSWDMNNEWRVELLLEDEPFSLRIASQPIPDRADWWEWCRNLKKLGVEFESQNSNGGWVTYKWGFKSPKTWYRIPAQPIPAGITKYLEKEMAEQKQYKPEIPHLEQQIQWHEDKLHSLRTGEPMREWEYRLVVGDGEWRICNDPHFSEKYEYRRKPKEITYYHCVISRLDKTTGLTITGVVTGFSKDDLESYVRGEKFKGQSTKFGPIVETTVEMED